MREQTFQWKTVERQSLRRETSEKRRSSGGPSKKSDKRARKNERTGLWLAVEGFPEERVWNVGLLLGHFSHGSQERILESVVMPSSRRSSPLREWTRVSCIAGRFFTTWPPGKPRWRRQGIWGPRWPLDWQVLDPLFVVFLCNMLWLAEWISGGFISKKKCEDSPQKFYPSKPPNALLTTKISRC